MVYDQTRIRPREWDTQNSTGFWERNGSLNPDQKTKFRNSYLKNKCQIADFEVLTDYSEETKEE